MTKKPLFTAPRQRVLLCTLVVFFATTVTTAGLTTYLPMELQTDQVALPALLFPFVWCALFLYSLMAKSHRQVWIVMFTLTLVHSALVYRHLVMI